MDFQMNVLKITNANAAFKNSVQCCGIFWRLKV